MARILFAARPRRKFLMASARKAPTDFVSQSAAVFCSPAIECCAETQGSRIA